jgi:hypothetical protein
MVASDEWDKQSTPSKSLQILRKEGEIQFDSTAAWTKGAYVKSPPNIRAFRKMEPRYGLRLRPGHPAYPAAHHIGTKGRILEDLAASDACEDISDH